MQIAPNNLTASVARVRDIANDIDQHAKAALADSALQARHQTTLCATTVILSGFLESFLREAAEEMVAEICKAGIPFDNLPAKVRATHYWEGGNWLREIAKRERSENPMRLAEASDVARRLASPGASPSAYEILWEAFADTQANPGPDQIAQFLKRFDIAEPLPTLAAAIKTTQNTLALRLRSFIEVRNECAHSGPTKSLTTTDVQGYCDLIEQIGGGVMDMFRKVLAEPPYAPLGQPVVPVAATPRRLAGRTGRTKTGDSRAPG